jgi:hypothetical protein
MMRTIRAGLGNKVMLPLQAGKIFDGGLESARGGKKDLHESVTAHTDFKPFRTRNSGLVLDKERQK